MLFGDFFKKTQPRGFTWTPRYFDPDSDEDLAEQRRRTRIQFDLYRSRARSKHRNIGSPWILLVFVIVLGALIYSFQRGIQITEVKDVTVTPANALRIERETAPVPAERTAAQDGTAVEDSLTPDAEGSGQSSGTGDRENAE